MKKNKNIILNGLIDLAQPRLGTKVVYKTDDFFAAAKRIIDPSPPIFKEGVFDKNGETNPKMMSMGLHCRIIGKPGRLKSLERFLDYVLEHKDVWICKRIDIAKHWIKNYSNI